jgi:hypothetical protein
LISSSFAALPFVLLIFAVESVSPIAIIPLLLRGSIGDGFKVKLLLILNLLSAA